MSKRTVRLTESELKSIITESVKRVLKEGVNTYAYVCYINNQGYIGNESEARECKEQGGVVIGPFDNEKDAKLWGVQNEYIEDENAFKFDI